MFAKSHVVFTTVVPTLTFILVDCYEAALTFLATKIARLFKVRFDVFVDMTFRGVFHCRFIRFGRSICLIWILNKVLYRDTVCCDDIVNQRVGMCEGGVCNHSLFDFLI